MNKYDPEDDIYQIGGIENDNRTKAKSRKFVVRYTHLARFKELLENANFCLSRIDAFNDKDESAFLIEEKELKRVFVACFTTSDIERIPMWFIYNRKNKTNIKIKIEFKKNKSFKDFIDRDKLITADCNAKYAALYSSAIKGQVPDWKINLEVVDVAYDTARTLELRRDIEIPSGFKKNITSYGMFKTKYWNYEKETRIIGVFTPARISNDVEHKKIEVPINFNIIKKIIVTFSPWDDKDNFIADIKEIDNLRLPFKVEFRNSILFDRIVRE